MEESVIRAAAKGDVAAFKKIFDFYVPIMRPLCRRYAHTVFEVDDILQESFVKVYNSLDSFRFEGSFEGWIKRIVVHTAIRSYKKNKNFNSIENIENIKKADSEEDILDDNVENIDLSGIIDIINTLPEGYRVVFNLYVFEDHSHKEIAEILEISEGTSRSQYSKAKKMIKKILYRQQNDSVGALVKKNQ